MITYQKVKKESAKTEKAWIGAGTEVGLQIWRIVKFEVKNVHTYHVFEAFVAACVSDVINVFSSQHQLNYLAT